MNRLLLVHAISIQKSIVLGANLSVFCSTANLIYFFNPNCLDTDGGRISLAMFGRRGAFVTKLFTTLILVFSGLIGFDNMNILLAYAVFVLVWQRELDSPTRNEVDELDFSRGLLGISTAILVFLVLIPMT